MTHERLSYAERKRQAPTTFRVPCREKKRLVLECRRKAVFEEVDRPRMSAIFDALWMPGQDNSAMVAKVRREYPPVRRNAAQRMLQAKALARGVAPVDLHAKPTHAAPSLLLSGGSVQSWRAAYPWGRTSSQAGMELLWHRQRLEVMRRDSRREDNARMAAIAKWGAGLVADGIDVGLRLAKERRDMADNMCACEHSEVEHRASWPSGGPQGRCMGGSSGWRDLKCTCQAFSSVAVANVAAIGDVG